jgi:hypothetical protein
VACRDVIVQLFDRFSAHCELPMVADFPTCRVVVVVLRNSSATRIVRAGRVANIATHDEAVTANIMRRDAQLLVIVVRIHTGMAMAMAEAVKSGNRDAEEKKKSLPAILCTYSYTYSVHGTVLIPVGVSTGSLGQ